MDDPWGKLDEDEEEARCIGKLFDLALEGEDVGDVIAGCKEAFAADGSKSLGLVLDDMELTGLDLTPLEGGPMSRVVYISAAGNDLEDLGKCNFPNVRYMDLAANSLVSMHMSWFPNLVALDLSDNPLEIKLIEWRLEHKKLRRLTLANCGLTAASLEGIVHLPKLKALDLRLNNIDDLGGLIDLARATPSLETFILKDNPCNESKEVESSVFSQWPLLQVFNGIPADDAVRDGAECIPAAIESAPEATLACTCSTGEPCDTPATCSDWPNREMLAKAGRLRNMRM